MALQFEGLADALIEEIRPGLSQEVFEQIGPLAAELVRARRLACYGVGREGLMMKAVAMRLYHLGLDAHVVGEMSMPALEDGDVLFVSAGPGDFSTVSGLVGVAKGTGARVCCITAEPGGAVPQAADHVTHLPAQTMAADQGEAATSVLPMGSLYELMMFLFFELLVLDLRDRIGISPEAMRANHTNME